MPLQAVKTQSIRLERKLFDIMRHARCEKTFGTKHAVKVDHEELQLVNLLKLNPTQLRLVIYIATERLPLPPKRVC